MVRRSQPPDEARRDRTDAQMAEATYRARLGGAAAPDGFVFGRFPISAEHIFYATPSTVAFVNLRPLVPGHVLVTPRRATPRTADLSADEFDDLVLTARRVAAVVEATHPGTAGCEPACRTARSPASRCRTCTCTCCRENDIELYR